MESEEAIMSVKTASVGDQEDWEKAECCGERMATAGNLREMYACRVCGKRLNRVMILKYMVLEARARVRSWEEDLELLKRFEAGREAEWLM